jgi:hypothetical protein
MPTVTFDTMLAERDDLATLIDTARRGGYEVALVDVQESDFPAPDEVIGRMPEGLDVDQCPIIEIGLHPIPDGHAGEPGAPLHPTSVRGGHGWGLFNIVFFGLPDVDPPLPITAIMDATFDENQIMHIIRQGACRHRPSACRFVPLLPRQLRAALVLCAHIWAQRDIFVSEHVEAFIQGGRRRALERLLNTRILTADEFIAGLAEHRLTTGA